LIPSVDAVSSNQKMGVAIFTLIVVAVLSTAMVGAAILEAGVGVVRSILGVVW